MRPARESSARSKARKGPGTRCSAPTWSVPRGWSCRSRPGCQSDAFKQRVEVEGGAQAQILVMGSQERVAGAAPLVAQHAQKCPLGVELRRISELYHHVAGDAVDAHVRPFGALGIIWLCDLAQQ